MLSLAPHLPCLASSAEPECRKDETDQTYPVDVAPDFADEYVAKAYVITARYQLPPDLMCDRCILQMIYCEFRLLGHGL